MNEKETVVASKRRGQNEGSIFQRKDGRWSASARYGAGRRKTVYGRTRAEVATKLTVMMKSVLDGESLPPEKLTVSAHIEKWLSTQISAVRPRTHERYSSLLHRHISPTLGGTRLGRMTPADLQSLYASLLDGGLSASTVSQLHRVLHHALNDAARWGLVARNVASLVKPPRVPRQEMQILTSVQARELLTAVNDDRLAGIYVIALHTGMRQGEIFGLRWRDVDLEAGSLRIEVGLVWNKGEWSLAEPKTAASRRTVHLSPPVLAALRRQRAEQNTEALRLGPDWQDTGLVFTNRAGGPVSPQNFLRREFYLALERAGLPRVRFHDLRHTAASLVLAQGVPIPQVSRLLGHSDPSVTLRVYAHALPDREHEAADALSAAISGA